jgi:hypothetical protein
MSADDVHFARRARSAEICQNRADDPAYVRGRVQKISVDDRDRSCSHAYQLLGYWRAGAAHSDHRYVELSQEVVDGPERVSLTVVQSRHIGCPAPKDRPSRREDAERAADGCDPLDGCESPLLNDDGRAQLSV